MKVEPVDGLILFASLITLVKYDMRMSDALKTLHMFMTRSAYAHEWVRSIGEGMG